MLVIAHRGASGYELENSIKSFKRAIEIGIDFIETDIQKTKDKQLIIFHDHLLDQNTNIKGYLKDFDFDTIRHRVKLNNGELIPTLDEVCDFARKNKVKFIFEIKNRDIFDEALNTISNYLTPMEYIIASFFHEELLQIRTKNKNILTCAIFECHPVNISRFVSEINCNYASIGFDTATKDMVQKIKNNGVKVLTWTVNDERDIKCAFEMNVDGIISNWPDRIKNS